MVFNWTANAVLKDGNTLTPIASGSVVFYKSYDNNTYSSIGTAVTNAGGTAALSYTADGIHYLMASYAETALYLGSSSPADYEDIPTSSRTNYGVNQALRRVWHGTRTYGTQESPSGWYAETYAWTEDLGYVAQQGEASLYLKTGVSTKIDGVLVTKTQYAFGDLVFDPILATTYRVTQQQATFLDPEDQRMAYRACKLVRIWNYPAPSV